MKHKLNRNFIISVTFFILFESIASAGTYTVNPTDQNEINEALRSAYQDGGGTVHLNTGVYVIDGPVLIGSNTRLEGDQNTIIRVSSSSSQWFTDGTGIIDSNDPSLHDIEICNLQIDGNLDQLPRSYANSGSGDHNSERLIDLRGSTNSFLNNIKIHDLKLYDAYSDGIHISFANNVYCYNNFCSNCQHEGIYYVNVLDGEMNGNEIAGITSDCLRLDNCVRIKVFDNILYSYSGNDNNGAYEHGENGLQAGDQGYSHGGGSLKPNHTQDIEIFNNTFADNGLRAIWLDAAGKQEGNNVYVHDNKFIDVSGLNTSGISFTNPPTVEMSENVFRSIFDILKVEFSDTGRTEQTADSIHYTVKKTENGIVAGGIKIIGFKDKIVWNNETYIPDNESVLYKAEAIKNPSLNFFSFGVEKMEKDVNVKIENGTATATMNITAQYYSTSKNSLTGKLKKGSIQKSVVTFTDSCPSPTVLKRQTNVTGTIYQYPTYFMASVPSNGLVKVYYEYNGSSVYHIYAVGERQTDENGIQYTDFSNLEYWSGDLQHHGNWLYVLGEFDRSKLNVAISTPYDDMNVEEFRIIKNDYPQEAIAFWFYPTIGFLICLYFIAKFFWRKIWF